MLETEAVEAFKSSSATRRSPILPAAHNSITAESSEAITVAASQRRANRIAAQSSSILGDATGTPTSHYVSAAKGGNGSQQQQTGTPGANIVSQVSRAPAAAAINNPNPKVRALADLVEKLGREIEGLLTYIEPRRNIHGDIRRMCSTIKYAHNKVVIELEAEERRAKSAPIRTPVQTKAASPPLVGNCAAQSAKRPRAKMSPRATAQEIAKKRKADDGTPRPQKMAPTQSTEKWQKVQKTRKPSKTKKKQ